MTADDNVPLLIIDPVTLFREGLRRILGEARFQPVWCSDRAPLGPIAAVSEKISPILIIGHDVEEALVEIQGVRRCYPTARVVLLAEHLSGPQLIAALQSGASTVLHRASSCETLIDALRLVVSGAIVLPADLLPVLLSHSGGDPLHALGPLPFAPELAPPLVPDDIAPEQQTGVTEARLRAPELTNLSAREFGVLEHLLDGLSNKEIAARLAIAEATVKVHVKAILRKARLRNRTQVAMWASRQGFPFLEAAQHL